MKAEILVATVLVLWAGPETTITAQDLWSQPYEEWTSQDAERILTDSPWSGQITLESMEWSPDEGREVPVQTIFTVRLFSALPVRAAFVRSLQLLNKYDSLSPKEREEVSKDFTIELPDADTFIIISLEVSSESLSLENRIKRALDNSDLGTLQRNISLNSEHLGRIPLTDIRPMAPDGSGLKLIFPRFVEGDSVLRTEDSGLGFELTVPWMTQTISYRWQTEELTIGGQLVY